jgi:hypothetical protein
MKGEFKFFTEKNKQKYFWLLQGPYNPIILYMVWGIPALNSDNAYDSHISMPIMADLLAFSPLTLHYAYFILTPAIGSVIFYTASSHIHDLHYSDALFMCFSAMTGAGLSVVRPPLLIVRILIWRLTFFLSKMDLSTLNSLQQGTLFCLLILGHAFPIIAIISLFRAWKLRSALRDNSNGEKQNQVACNKQGALSAKDTCNAKATTVVREVQPDVSSPCGPEGSSDDYGFIVVTDLKHPEQSQQVTSLIVDKEKVLGNRKAHISWLKGIVQRASKLLSCKKPTNYRELDEVEYRALALTAVLIILYFIGFLILGIVSIGLWSKFVRPDIPREDGASPFWAGAFLATSALCNNGMSLIDTNMGAYQKEWVIRRRKLFVEAFRWHDPQTLSASCLRRSYPCWEYAFPLPIKIPYLGVKTDVAE